MDRARTDAALVAGHWGPLRIGLWPPCEKYIPMLQELIWSPILKFYSFGVIMFHRPLGGALERIRADSSAPACSGPVWCHESPSKLGSRF